MDKTKEVIEQEFFEFLDLLSRLNPIEFFGVATWLQVPCFEDFERKTPRPVENIMSDLLDAFLVVPHSKRKEVLKMMRKVARPRSVKH